jgi:PAS domain S-box-containing protein
MAPNLTLDGTALASPPGLTPRELRAVFDGAADALWLADGEFRFVDANPAGAALLGLPREQILGRSVAEFGTGWQEGIRAGGEFAATLPNGGKRIVQLAKSLGPSGGLAILRDITARRRTETELQRHQSDLRDFVENAPVGLHGVGPDGTILWVNQAELDMLGYAREDYVGRHIGEFHVDRPAIEEVLRRLGAGETLPPFEARLRCKDGSIRRVQIISNVKWEDGRFVHTRCFTRDVTEQRRAAEDLAQAYEDAQEALKVRDGFLSVAGHELRTPLGALGLSLQNLARRVARNPDAATERAVESLQRQVDRLTRLTEDLLEVGRIRSGKLVLDRERTDLAGLAAEVAERFRESASAAGSTLTVASKEPVLGHWDASRLDQVLTNLLANAVKFGEGRPIVVEVRRRGDRAALSVCDGGIGISTADQARIFERFERSSAAKSYRGIGLGLWISRQVVEAHGGTIVVESRPGEGASFRVELPDAEVS